MAEKYFVVKQDPKAWGDARQTCSAVVTMAPWNHSAISLGNINVRTRKSWGAPKPLWRNEVVYYNIASLPLAAILNKIVIHHTNNALSILDNEMKQRSRGFATLGYHFFVGRNGIVYEGRPLEIMGSHAGEGFIRGPLNDPDWGAIGIVMQGDFHRKDDWFFHTEASKKQLASLEKLILQLKSKYSINQLLMHREVKRSGKPTVCPGDYLVPIIEKLRSTLKMKGPQ